MFRFSRLGPQGEQVTNSAYGDAGASPAASGDTATMPIEFSVAAYRLGHSMIRGNYQWNRVFNGGPTGVLGIASLFQLFTFSGTSGNLTPTDPNNPEALDDPNSGTFLRLPTNWIVDWRRLHDFTTTTLAEPIPPDGLVTLPNARWKSAPTPSSVSPVAAHLRPDRDTFRMVDLLMFAFNDDVAGINPLGDA